MKSTILTLVISLWVGGLASAEDKSWREQTSALFDVFANAMVTAKYSTLFEVFDAVSSDEYRKLMLVQYGMMEPKDQSQLPAGDDGKPLSLAALRALSNDQFWAVNIRFFRKLEDGVSEKLRAAHGALGMPKYTLHRAFREGDRVFMLLEKTFDIKARAPLPYEVLEAVLEGDEWKLCVPRGMTWQMQEDISKAKEKARAGK